MAFGSLVVKPLQIHALVFRRRKKRSFPLSLNSIPRVHVRYLMLILFFPFPFYPRLFSFQREKCVHRVHNPSSLTLHLLSLTSFTYFTSSWFLSSNCLTQMYPQLFFLVAGCLSYQDSNRAPTSNLEKPSISPSVLPTGPSASYHSIANR